MKRPILFFAVVAGLSPLLTPISAQAQAARTWVSGVGDDVNPCSRTAPCKTFAGAISKTFINGEINCLDPAGYSSVTVTKSITIDCSATGGSILTGAANGIIVNIPSGNANDPLRTVRIRGLSINGTGPSGSVGTRIGSRGISVLNASVVYVEDVVISDFAAQGIANESVSAQSRVYITNSIIRNNAQSGVFSNAAATGIMVIDNSVFEGNNYGVAAGSGNNVVVSRSVMSGSGASGVWAASGGQIAVSSSVLTHNNSGVEVLAGGTIRVSENDIAFNNQAFTGSATTFGNNRVTGNVALGTAPTAAGGAAPDLGQL